MRTHEMVSTIRALTDCAVIVIQDAPQAVAMKGA